MTISIQAILLSRLRDPALYLLGIFVIVLAVSKKTTELYSALIFGVAYVVLHLILEIILRRYSKQTDTAAPSFIVTFERYLLIFFILIAAIVFGVGAFVLKKPLLDTLVVSVTLLVITVPKNIVVASRLFVLPRARPFSPEECTKLAAVDTIIINSDEFAEKALSLQDILADNRIIHISDFPIDTKVGTFIALSTKPSEFSLTIPQDIERIQKEYKEVATQEQKKEYSLSFYSYESKNVALMQGNSETLLDYCDFIEEEGKVKRLSFGAKKDLLKKLKELTLENRVVKALAYKPYTGTKLADSKVDFIFVAFLIYEYAPKKELFDLFTFLRTIKLHPILLSTKSATQVNHTASELGILSEDASAFTWDPQITDSQLREQLSTAPAIGKSTPATEKRLLDLFGKRAYVINDVLQLQSFLAVLEDGKQYLSNLANFIRYEFIFSLSLVFLLLGAFFLPANFPSFSLSALLFFSVLFSLPQFTLAFEKDISLLKRKLSPNLVFFQTIPFASLLTALTMVLLVLYVFSSTNQSFTNIFFVFMGLHTFNLLSTRSLNRSCISSLKSRLALAIFLVFLIVWLSFAFIPQVQKYFNLLPITTPTLLLLLGISFGALIVEEVRKKLIKI